MSALTRILLPLLLGVLPAARIQGADVPPKLGLALSGGGARGIAHIGALKALEEKGIHVDYIAGTSMGAVIGSLYASGYSADRLLEIVSAIDWQNIFSGEPERRLVPLERRLQEIPPVVRVAYGLWNIKPPTSVLSDYRIQQMLSRYLTEPNLRAGRQFDRLPIPFRPVAADLRSGERVILTEGSLARAVRASMAIPLAFSPVPWNGRLLVDGGIADNVPVGVVRDMGAEAVIAIDISSPPEELSEPSVFGIANQLTELLISSRNAAIREDPDLYLRPDLGRHSFMDYSNFEALLEQGYQAAMDRMEEIEQLAGGSGTADGSALERDVEELQSRPIITEIAIEGNEYFEDEVIQREFGVASGARLDMDAVLAGLDRCFAVGLFETAWIEAVPLEPGHVRLVLHLQEAEARVADIGVSYNEDDEAAAFVRLNNRNLLGWGEHEQFAVDASDRTTGFRLRVLRPALFFSPMGLEMRAELREDNPRFVRDGAFVNRAEFDRRAFSLSGHLPVGRVSLLRFGFRLENVITEERAGLDFGPAENGLRLLFLSVNADNLDDFYRPTRGTAFSVTLERNVRASETLDTYWRGLARGRLALRVHDRGVLEGTGLLGLTEGGLPISEQFRIGGPVLLPGLRRDGLWGNQAFGLSAAYRFLVSSNLSLIARVSSGSVWEETSDIDFASLRFGGAFGVQYETPVGPIKVDFGVHENGSTRIYFSAGFF